MSPPTPRLDPRLPPLLFVAAVIGHCVLLNVLGFPSPGGLTADANVYLELALNLFRDGTYGTRVAITYPPLYPMLLAPTFAIASNALQFAVIYTMHGLFLALGTLACLPMLTHHLGRERAWLALALVQLAGGATLHGYNTQTEPLFTALLTGTIGLAWTAWSRPRWWIWTLVGLLAGLAVCTRKMGLVLPMALALLVGADLWAWIRGRGPFPGGRAAWMAAGLSVGLVPDVVADHLHGGAVEPYGGGAASSHLTAGVRAAQSWQTAVLMLRIGLRHVSYLAAVTLGAPLVIGAAFSRFGHPRPPLALARVLQLLLWVTAGSIGMTTLHMTRYWLRPGRTGWDLYPRYVDPVEPALLLVGLVAAVWLAANRPASHWRARLLPVVPWLGLAVFGFALSGAMDRTRGGRLLRTPELARRLHRMVEGLGDIAPLLFVGVGLLLLGWWAWRHAMGRTAGLRHLALAILVSWAVSFHSPLSRLMHRPRAPKIMSASSLVAEPRAELAIIVPRPGPSSRKYYEPAFRSDHQIWFVTRREVHTWAAAHPRGYLLYLKGDPRIDGFALRQRQAEWLIYRASEEAP